MEVLRPIQGRQDWRGCQLNLQIFCGSMDFDFFGFNPKTIPELGNCDLVIVKYEKRISKSIIIRIRVKPESNKYIPG
jgi:hypothetical protein